MERERRARSGGKSQQAGKAGDVTPAAEIRKQQELDRMIAEMVRTTAIPVAALPTAEEAASRDEAWGRILEVRARIGPVPVPVWQLIRQQRGEDAPEGERG